MMVERIEFVVNGVQARVEVDSTTPLLAVLREALNLRGSKFGCGTEQCGACMVLVDGKPVYSCTREVGSVAGRTVMTIEALSHDDERHPLQQAFIDEQAGQCGYCLSGILISSVALLERNKAPTREEVIAALEPHLCRCGIHNRAIRAVQKAGTVLASAPSK
ncbi:MAG: isoquinoline 1-oxidoreductase, alpha subunit [Xanthobacteraceae bacterium]|jgi:aerobic-type carbon monoxide dehydrogenase small subunit (CoxS/CutS family)|nr:isoquinoline 1-oxidoreductase, alpha subunit [Xanthobacteraceae bacterium]